MKTLLAVSLFVGVVTALAAAEAAPTMSQHFKPGDPLHYRVTFQKDVDFERLSLNFYRLGGQPVPKEQERFGQAFGISEVRRISPGVYEVNGLVPVHLISGTYQMTLVEPSHDNVVKDYTFGADFPEKLTVEIDDDSGVEFPAIKSITPQ